MGNDTPLQAGDRIIIGGDVFLYAWWKDDPEVNPYTIEADSSGGGVIITDYSRYNWPSAVIPETLNEKPVTGIGEAAFAGAYLQAVTLPARLEFIGNKAFTGNWFSRLQIPDSVRSIGKLAFQNVGLESLDLGSGLELIDDYAFDGNRLQNLFLPSRIKQLGEGAFADNPLETIEIGDAVALHNDIALGIHGAARVARSMGLSNEGEFRAMGISSFIATHAWVTNTVYKEGFLRRSLGLEPWAGPTTPLCSISSTKRAARL
jgi:hypothetical protein